MRKIDPREQPVLFFDVPAGTHDLAVDFERTGPRRLGDGLTLAGLAGIALLALWPVRAGRT